MKNKFLLLVMSCALAFSLCACGGETKEEIPDVTEEVVEEPEVEEPVVEEPVEEETREGMYRSELTNEWIDESLKNQRPLAVMVDNEKTALPHYGTSDADVVYEMMNSTLNGHITRFMVIMKDYQKIEQLGSIRSVRTTNLQLAPEWNAIVCHDGGPFYIDYFLVNPYVDNFSGGFSRVNNGKSREFTEYILAGDVESRLANNPDVSVEYTKYYQGSHFQFASETNPVVLADATDSEDCVNIELPFDHNASKLEYIEESGLYRYSEYGAEYKDAGNGEYMEFTNVILQNTQYEKYDENGYMNFLVTKSGRSGYYITGGKAIPVTWSKEGDIYPTKYFNEAGEEITLNTGKTYIALVADDKWEELVIE